MSYWSDLDVNNPSVGAVEHVVPLLVLTHVVGGVEGANHQGLFRKLLPPSRSPHSARRFKGIVHKGRVVPITPEGIHSRPILSNSA